MSPFSHPALSFDPQSHGAFIFDCDGTLADSMPLHYRAWKEAFESCRARFEFTPAIMHEMAGIGTIDSVVVLNERFGDTLDPERVVELMSENLGRIHHLVKPIEPVMAVARALHALKKPIAVASGGTVKHVRLTLGHIGADKLFDIVVTREDVARSKPHPDTFLKAAELLGAAPETCLVFEDSPFGIQAAQAAGMAHILVPDPAQL